MGSWWVGLGPFLPAWSLSDAGLENSAGSTDCTDFISKAGAQV